MWTDCGERAYLEDVFGIFKFRHRGMCSFRQFVILNVSPDAHDERIEEAATQPVRVLHP